MCKKCLKCNSERVINIEAHMERNVYTQYRGHEFVGGIPDSINIAYKGHLDIDMCLECGQVQGTFPVADLDLAEQTEIMQAMTA